MAVTNGWGQGAVNNTNNWGKGKTSATNNWGKIYDSSASGDTSLGTATPFTNIYSVSFDGFNDLTTMGDVLNTSDTAADTLSLSCWFKTSDSSTQILMAKQDKDSPFSGYSLAIVSSNKIYFNIGNYTGNKYIQLRTGAISNLSNGNWHHIAVTYDGSRAASGVNIYFDNSALSLTIGNNQQPVGTQNTEHFMIGARGKGTTGDFALPFDGNIDEAAYFTTELSASDINTIYGTGVPNDISSLNPVGWWRMGDNDGGTGSTVTDQGSGSNNGTLINSPTFQEDVPN